MELCAWERTVGERLDFDILYNVGQATQIL